ncbi:MAG: DNA translocase FtsK [Terriglobales bacterium]
MKYIAAAFTPTSSKRLNELIGFLLFVSALLVLLALGSYSPLDPSLNTAAPPPELRAPRNWIGMVGAYGADVVLQVGGIAAFLLPVFIALLSVRWFWSRKVESPAARLVGALMLLVFVPALLGLLPWHWRWLGAVPIEGLVGRIIGDAFIHYLNLAGAYIVAMALIAVALYLSTAFSFGAMRLWISTHCAFLFAAWDRVQDWRNARAKARAQQELEKKRAARATASSELVQVKPKEVPPAPVKTGIEREAEEETSAAPAMEPEQLPDIASVPGVQVVERADADPRRKTTMPRLAGAFNLPSSALLVRPDDQNAVDIEELKIVADVLTKKCAEFDVHGQVTQINPGPVVTTFEFKPEAGIKYSRITSLSDDLCLALRAESILIERMPGKSTVGVQVPNREREIIRLRELIEADEFRTAKSKLTLALGKDINGAMAVADLATMPHLLIAGSTGSGKSVAINAMLMSLLYRATPEQLRLILVDPKRLELGVYEGLPHLYTPIITEAKLAANALRNAVREMERRLKVLAEKGVRNIDQYNRLFDEETPSLFSESEEKRLPYLVIFIDELADLMMLDQNNVEESITRLAQMARAVGIHLVLATQRPSVDVITGLIKANFPARISFRVATKVDSRTILDGNGAEALLGRGDMLYLPAGSGRLIRLHAPFVAEKEIAAVVEFWRNQASAQYVDGFLDAPREEGTRADANGNGNGEEFEGEDDELYQDAVRLVLEFGKASTSLLQRRLRIGYGRAAHLIDLMEQDGIVGAADGPKPREVLKRPDWLSEVEGSLR